MISSNYPNTQQIPPSTRLTRSKPLTYHVQDRLLLSTQNPRRLSRVVPTNSPPYHLSHQSSSKRNIHVRTRTTRPPQRRKTKVLVLEMSKIHRTPSQSKLSKTRIPHPRHHYLSHLRQSQTPTITTYPIETIHTTGPVTPFLRPANHSIDEH